MHHPSTNVFGSAISASTDSSSLEITFSIALASVPATQRAARLYWQCRAHSSECRSYLRSRLLAPCSMRTTRFLRKSNCVRFRPPSATSRRVRASRERHRRYGAFTAQRSSWSTSGSAPASAIAASMSCVDRRRRFSVRLVDWLRLLLLGNANVMALAMHIDVQRVCLRLLELNRSSISPSHGAVPSSRLTSRTTRRRTFSIGSRRPAARCPHLRASMPPMPAPRGSGP